MIQQFAHARAYKGSKSPSAFTLVELIVVVGIITLLGAILFSVFSRVRQQGYRSTCQSNLHQIALAM